MYHQGKIGIAVSILVCFILQTQGADKYTDENRPYEFGFNVEIDGSKQQHRHEKKDKDGIIMGEFGFVTADDVYHVTVYATDKEGRFKILSMKNIHLKKASGAGAARQGHALALPAAPAAPVAPPAPAAQPNAVSQAAPTSPLQPPFKQISLEPPGRSCSSCSIPTTTRVPPPAPAVNFIPPSQDTFSGPAPALANNAQQGGFGNQPFNPQNGSPNYSQQGPAISPSAQNFPQQPGQAQQNFPGSPNNGPVSNTPNDYAQAGPSPPYGQIPAQLGQQEGQQFPDGPTPPQTSAPQTGPASRTSKQYTGPAQQFDSNQGPQAQPGSAGQPGPVKPTLVSAQMQIVDKNTDIHSLRPGETPGLPAGLTHDDMTQLLYTFNYTVGFHGHFEEGYRNGAKKGYYFVTGRNGVRTRIDYTADDTGFHPKVSQEVLDLLSDDVPKPETEKDAKYGLKGYEFKWLYYPVDSNSR